MLFLENLRFLWIMKVLNCVFLMVFDVWICSMIWEVIIGCGGIVGGLKWSIILVILVAFGCLKLCVDA